jgi:hypothetical protein
MTDLEYAQMMHEIPLALGYGILGAMAIVPCLMGLAYIVGIFKRIVKRLIGEFKKMYAAEVQSMKKRYDPWGGPY